MTTPKCQHPRRDQVVDQHEGSVICKTCCTVIDIDYQYSDPIEINFCDGSPLLSSICLNNHIQPGILHKANKIRRYIRLKLTKRSIFHIELFSLYYAAMQSDTPYLIEEIAVMFGLRITEATKIINSISKSTKYIFANRSILNPMKYMNRLSREITSVKECAEIHKKYACLPFEFSLKNPALLVSAIIFNHKKQNLEKYEVERLATKISSRLSVSVRSIRLLDRKIEGHFRGKLVF